MTDYVLGVDGGNTKTIALVARRDGCILGTGRGGCGDIYGAESAQAAVHTVAGAVQAALDAAGIEAGRLAAGVFSMAGADWPEDFELLHGAMAERGFGRRVIVVNDALGALRAGSADGTGVSVVCGTGVATGARNAAGQVWHSSFWQTVAGSVELGNKMLRAVYRAELGLAPPTALTRRVLDHFGRASVEEVLHLLTARGSRHRGSAGDLARPLLEEAGRGDPTAARIVREHGIELGNCALVAARKVGLTQSGFNLVLAGSVMKSPVRVLKEAVIQRVRQESPEVRPLDSRYEPAIGALFLALEACGVAVDADLLARVDATLPPSGLFET